MTCQLVGSAESLCTAWKWTCVRLFSSVCSNVASLVLKTVESLLKIRSNKLAFVSRKRFSCSGML